MLEINKTKKFQSIFNGRLNFGLSFNNSLNSTNDIEKKTNTTADFKDKIIKKEIYEKSKKNEIFRNVNSSFKELVNIDSKKITTDILNKSLTEINNHISKIQNDANYENDSHLQNAVSSLTTTTNEIQNLLDSGELSNLKRLKTNLAISDSELTTFSLISNTQIQSIQNSLSSITAQIAEVEAIATTLNQANSDLNALSTDLTSFLNTNNTELTEGTTTTINTITANHQDQSTLIALSGGNLLTVYESYEFSSTKDTALVGQITDKDGNKISGEFLIDSDQISNGDYKVTALDDGGFAIAYTDSTLRVSDTIHVRKFDANGSQVGSTLDFSGSNINSLSLHSTDSGHYALFYSEGDAIKAQHFSADGTTNGTTQTVISDAGYHDGITFTALDDGNFVVAYGSQASDSKVQKFDSSGNLIGNAIAVGMDQVKKKLGERHITAITGGGFVVVGRGKDSNSLAKVYDSNGNQVGSDININDIFQANMNSITTTALDGGNFAISYIKLDNNLAGVHTQLFDANGNALTDETLVNTTTAQNQVNQEVLALNDGGYVVAYTSLDAGGTVLMQRYNADGTTNGNEIVVDTSTATNDAPSLALTSEGIAITYTTGGSDSNIKMKTYDFEAGGGISSPLINQMNTIKSTIDTALSPLNVDNENLYAIIDATASNLDSILNDIDAMTNIVDVSEQTAIHAGIQSVRDSLTAYLSLGKTESKTELENSQISLQNDLTEAQQTKIDGIATRQATIDDINTNISNQEKVIEENYLNIIKELSNAVKEIQTSSITENKIHKLDTKKYLYESDSEEYKEFIKDFLFDSNTFNIRFMVSENSGISPQMISDFSILTDSIRKKTMEEQKNTDKEDNIIKSTEAKKISTQVREDILKSHFSHTNLRFHKF